MLPGLNNRVICHFSPFKYDDTIIMSILFASLALYSASVRWYEKKMRRRKKGKEAEIMMWNFYVLFRLSAEMEGGFETVFKATFLRTLKSLLNDFKDTKLNGWANDKIQSIFHFGIRCGNERV